MIDHTSLKSANYVLEWADTSNWYEMIQTLQHISSVRVKLGSLILSQSTVPNSVLLFHRKFNFYFALISSKTLIIFIIFLLKG